MSINKIELGRPVSQKIIARLAVTLVGVAWTIWYEKENNEIKYRPILSIEKSYSSSYNSNLGSIDGFTTPVTLKNIGETEALKINIHLEDNDKILEKNTFFLHFLA